MSLIGPILTHELITLGPLSVAGPTKRRGNARMTISEVGATRPPVNQGRLVLAKLMCPQ
jgi:hypothetical protein